MTGFIAGFVAMVGVRDETWGLGIEAGSEKEVTEVGRMVEGDRGVDCELRGQIRVYGDSLRISLKD